MSIPTQDMVLGLYWLTFQPDEYKGPAKAALADDALYGRRCCATARARRNKPDGTASYMAFKDGNDAITAYNHRLIGLHEWIEVRYERRRASRRRSAA